MVLLEDSIVKYKTTCDKLNNLIAQEEAYRKQRAKVYWLKDGDINLKFFHLDALATKKWILSLLFLVRMVISTLVRLILVKLLRIILRIFIVMVMRVLM